VAARNEIASALFLIMNSLLMKEAEAKSRYRFWISHFFKEINGLNFVAYFRAEDTRLLKFFFSGCPQKILTF
jgi:predicted HicB family RNase H-like nuclease